MELAAYIDRYHEGNKSGFAREAGLKRTTLLKILSGSIPRVNHALVIEETTGGRVNCYDLAKRPRFRKAKK